MCSTLVQSQHTEAQLYAYRELHACLAGYDFSYRSSVVHYIFFCHLISRAAGGEIKLEAMEPEYSAYVARTTGKVRPGGRKLAARRIVGRLWWTGILDRPGDSESPSLLPIPAQTGTKTG